MDVLLDRAAQHMERLPDENRPEQHDAQDGAATRRPDGRGNRDGDNHGEGRYSNPRDVGGPEQRLDEVDGSYDGNGVEHGSGVWARHRSLPPPAREKEERQDFAAKC